MIVYQADKKEFLLDYDDRDIEDLIHAKYQAATSRKVAKAEIRSWRESLGYIARVLRDSAIADDVVNGTPELIQFSRHRHFSFDTPICSVIAVPAALSR